MPTPPFEQVQRQWYHWFMATERGARAVRADPHGFAHIHWVNWSPAGWFSEATFEGVAPGFDNPDWVDVTLHSYRARWDEAEPDESSRWLEARQVDRQPVVAHALLSGRGGRREPAVDEPLAAVEVRRPVRAGLAARRRPLHPARRRPR